MSVTVNYLGILAERAGTGVESYELEGSVDSLLETIRKKHPGMGKLTCVPAINGVVDHGKNTRLKNGDRITLIPPFPGG